MLDLATVRERYLLGACSDPVCAVRYAPLRSWAGRNKGQACAPAPESNNAVVDESILRGAQHARLAQQYPRRVHLYHSEAWHTPHQRQTIVFHKIIATTALFAYGTEKQRSIKREAFLSTIRNLIWEPYNAFWHGFNQLGSFSPEVDQ